MSSSPCFIEIPVFNANSADPDQTPRPAASDLGLHSLPMPLYWDARLNVSLSILVLKFEQIHYTDAFFSHSVLIL